MRLSIFPRLIWFITLTAVCVWENIPKLLLSHVICSISLIVPLKRFPMGSNLKEIVACDEIMKKALLFRDIYNVLAGPLSLWVEPKKLLSAPLFTFCSPLLILQQVMIIKGGPVALRSCKKVYIDFCSLAAASENSIMLLLGTGASVRLCVGAAAWDIALIGNHTSYSHYQWCYLAV